MTPNKKRAMLAWAYSLSALLLTLTIIVSFSAGTAQGLQGTATPTPSAPVGNDGATAQELLQHAQGEADRLDNFDAETVILLALRSLQAAYSPEADVLLTRMMDRLTSIETLYDDPNQDYKYINELATSPDGRLVATAQNSNYLRVYDAQTGTLVGKWPTGSSELRTIAFSPDSLTIAVGGDSGKLELWDVVTGTARFSSSAYVGGIEDVVFSPNGSLVVAVTDVGEIRVLEAQTGNLVRKLDFEYGIYTAVFSPDGQTLLLGDSGYGVYLWDVASGDMKLETTLPTVVYGAAFMPDGQHVVLSAESSTLYVMDIPSGEISQTITTPTGVERIALSPDGQYLLAGASYYSRGFLYDTSTWEIVQSYASQGYQVDDLAFSPDGQHVYMAGNYAQVRRWPLFPADLPDHLGGHVMNINVATYSPDSQTILTIDGRGLVQIWDATSHQLLNHMQLRYEDDVTPAVYWGGFVTPDRIWVSTDRGFEIWDVATGQLTLQIAADDRGYSPPIATVSRDGSTAVISFNNGYIGLYDLTTGDLIQSMHQNNAVVYHLELSQDGTRLAAAGSDDRIRIFDVAAGRVIKVLGKYEDTVSAIALSPDGTQVLVGTYANRVQIVDITSGRVLRTLQSGLESFGYIARAEFSDDTVRVMAQSADNTIMIWDVPSANLLRIFGISTGSLTDAHYSPDETQVLVGSYGPAAQIWSVDLATTIEQACALLTHDLSAEQLEGYGITNDVPPCPNLTPAESAVAPTWTPNPTNTLPVWTPLPTLRPTDTPTPSPTPRQFTAQLGENRGSLELGETQQWTFEGQPGQAITIELRADHPANDTDDTTRASEHLLDTYLRVYTTYGVLLAENDDIEPGVQTDSEVFELTPPYPGTVVIEVTSFDGLTAGDYTLVISVSDNAESVDIVTPTPTPN